KLVPYRRATASGLPLAIRRAGDRRLQRALACQAPRTFGEPFEPPCTARGARAKRIAAHARVSSRRQRMQSGRPALIEDGNLPGASFMIFAVTSSPIKPRCKSRYGEMLQDEKFSQVHV